MSRGIHTKPVEGATDEWLTPPEIIQALGKFDHDPCAHPQQFYRTAKYMTSLPDDGLQVDWIRRVWLNPPYGRETGKWLQKLAEHGRGTALVPARTEVESWFWTFVWQEAWGVLFLKGRLYFRKPDGSKAGNAGHGSVLVAYGESDSDKLLHSGLEGMFFCLNDEGTITGADWRRR